MKKTVREVAEEIGVTRQTIYSKLTDQFKSKFTTVELRNGKETLVISKDGIDSLREVVNKPYSKDGENDSKKNNDSYNQIDSINEQLIDLLTKNIEVLEAQLEIKDKQISELNERLKESQQLNYNNQALLKINQDTKMIGGEDPNKKKESIFKRLFKKNEDS